MRYEIGEIVALRDSTLVVKGRRILRTKYGRKEYYMFEALSGQRYGFTNDEIAANAVGTPFPDHHLKEQQ